MNSLRRPGEIGLVLHLRCESGSSINLNPRARLWFNGVVMKFLTHVNVKKELLKFVKDS
jgi:hypothetical protein